MPSNRLHLTVCLSLNQNLDVSSVFCQAYLANEFILALYVVEESHFWDKKRNWVKYLRYHLLNYGHINSCCECSIWPETFIKRSKSQFWCHIFAGMLCPALVHRLIENHSSRISEISCTSALSFHRWTSSDSSTQRWSTTSTMMWWPNLGPSWLRASWMQVSIRCDYLRFMD